MRVIFIPDMWALLVCFLLWPVFQVSAALICLNLPDRYFNPGSWPYRELKFEREGDIYNRIFHVSRWKQLLPDGGTVWKKRGFKKKRLENFSKENLNRFLVESARGEMTHWLAILPFWTFGFFTPATVIWIMLAYALLINLPCILVQRYNRPRVQRLLIRLEKE